MSTVDYVELFELVSKENFDEQRYLEQNQDVKRAVAEGVIESARKHCLRHGLKEKRSQQKRVEDYLDELVRLRKRKLVRIKKRLKKGIDVRINDQMVVDYTGSGRKEKFGFSETDNVSSFFYDDLPLEIINRNSEGLILDCGAGFRPVYYENVVNYEIVPYPTTDVIGFAEDLPFEDNSFDAVFSFAVLEHVKLPFEAAAEMCRVLKPGGTMAVCTAFLQPVHGYPHHYYNMTHMGLKALFEDAIDIERQFVNSGTGPVWSLSWILRRWAKQLPVRERKKFLKMKVADLIDHPFEYLDHGFVTALPEEANFELASATLLVGTKRNQPG